MLISNVSQDRTIPYPVMPYRRDNCRNSPLLRWQCPENEQTLPEQGGQAGEGR